MRLFSCFLISVMVAVYLLPGRFAYGHDCPLQKMGTLETFRALDQDKNRRLSLEEFVDQGWCQEAPSCQCQGAARQFFQRLDKNRDGFITLEEYQALKRDQEQPRR